MTTHAESAAMPRAFAYGLAVTVAIFWLMHLAIEGGGEAFEKSQPLPTIDFVRLKKDAELETRERRKPPKPEPPKQPPPPKMQIDTPPPPDQPPLPFAMPKMSLPSGVTGGPFLGNFSAADASGYSELIPLVRIAPQYPRQAARDRIEGYVVIEITVNPDGTVKTARPIDAKPRGVFESSAVQSILKWKFRPKVEDGKPIEFKGIQRLEFNLGGEE